MMRWMGIVLWMVGLGFISWNADAAKPRVFQTNIVGGLQVGPALRSDAETDQLIANLNAFAAYGFNSVVTFIPAQTESGEAVIVRQSLNVPADYLARLDRLVEAANYRSIQIVLGLFDRGTEAVLQDESSYHQAAQAIALHLKSTRYPPFLVIAHTTHPIISMKADALQSIADAIHEVSSTYFVAAGSADKETFERLAKDDAIDILTAESDAEIEMFERQRGAGRSKPLFDLREFGNGGWYKKDDGTVMQGVWFEGPIEADSFPASAYRSAVRYARQTPGVYFFPAFSSWFNGSRRGESYDNHYTLGGAGRDDDPGVMWYAMLLDDALRTDEERRALQQGYQLDGPVVSEAERQEGFEPLFDGKSLQGWTQAGANSDWYVDNGVLVGPKNSGSWVRSWRRYRSFVLRLEVTLEPGCNSGIFLRAPLAARQSRVGIEIQLLGQNETPTIGSSASLYGAEAARIDAFRKPGEWNEIEIDYRGRLIKVTVNGEIVHDRDLTGHPVLGNRLLEGFIGLQAHGHGSARFRNIRIKPIDETAP